MTEQPPALAEKKRENAMRSIVLERPLPNRRQFAAGLGGAVVAHLLFWLLIPNDPFHSDGERPPPRFRELSLELEDPLEEEQYYTQTNPEAPENEPDFTDRYGARSQQAANPELPEEIDPDNRPARESELDLETDQFLTGDLSMPEFAPPPPQQQSEAESEQPSPENAPLLSVVTEEEEAAERQVPTSGLLDEDEELEEEGIADYAQRDTEEDPTNPTDEREGEAESGEREGESATEVAVVSPPSAPSQPSVVSDDIPTPRPRPRLPRVAPSATSTLRSGVSTIGAVAADASASELGEYSERMVETVSLIWDSIVSKSSNPDRDSKVILRFKLTNEGLVEDLEVREGTTARALSIYECRTAIENGQSYGRWTEEMTRQHGDFKEITFVFYYLR